MESNTWRAASRACIAALLLPLASAALADEGMWTFDNPPSEHVRQRYDVSLTPDLLDQWQHAAVNYGASASFVAKDGLMLTNHHVALRCIEQLSSSGRDLASEGFMARSPAEELRCPGGMARVLMSTEDVTAAIAKAVAGKGNDEQRNTRRKAAIAEIEAGCRSVTRLHCEVIALYSGSLFHLYRYKEWEDVRLVFAPEYQAAFFGGDPDNFVFPRFALDFALFRIYENGQPLQVPRPLKLASQPPAEGDPVFVVGHPGETDRLYTLAQMQAERDVFVPLRLASGRAQRVLLQAYSARSPEAARHALDSLFGVENWLKAMLGQYAALKDPALMAQKAKDEAEFRAAYRRQGQAGDPWRDVAAATARHVARAKELWAVGYGYHTLFDMAGMLVEQAYERRLPQAQRLTIYREARWPALERRIRADVPVYADLEVARTARDWREAQSLLGVAHPFVRTVLAGDSAEAAAERVVRGSRLGDPAVRAALLAGGVPAIEASDDPLILLARKVYPMHRELARFEEVRVDTPLQQAAERLGQARFAAYGKALPPDATGSLRLSYGKVSGYDAAGIATPAKTTFGGLYARADSFDGKPPFDLAPRVDAARSQLDMRLPLDFVTTADIIGGNSGSPVLDRHGDWIGLIFDGNLDGLGGRYVYTDIAARSIAVDAQAIVTALERIYGAPALAQELRDGHR